ncbi:MAG: germination protein YpeB [Lachnospiraceae bacterium]|nr:germination protein YpeB [Lachnospiraceae bacterium]
MKRIRKICAGIISLSLMLSFTACEKAKKDTIADDLKENVGVEASAGDTKQRHEIDEVPDKISYTLEAGGRIAKIDAKVYADGYGNVPVFSVTRCEDKEEWVSDHAKKLFDNGEYKNVRPYEVLNREELEEELQFYKERMEDGENTNGDEAWFVSNIEYYLKHFNEDDYVKYPDNKLIYTKEVANEEQQFRRTVNEASLRGYVDGRTWTLSYVDGDYDNYIDGVPKPFEYMPCLEAHCIDEEYYVGNLSGIQETYLNNLCSRDDAEKQAKEFLERLGFGNMELLYIGQNNLATVGEFVVDGYTMVFGMSENGAHLLFSFASGMTVMTREGWSNDEAAQPYVEVQVNSNGVYGIKIMGNYNEPEIMSRESAMLSFEQVNEIAKEELTKALAGDTNGNYNVGTIEFGYAYITYDGLSYAIVPAWRYYDSQSDRTAKERFARLTICALDGAVIFDHSANIYDGSGILPY